MKLDLTKRILVHILIILLITTAIVVPVSNVVAENGDPQSTAKESEVQYDNNDIRIEKMDSSEVLHDLQSEIYGSNFDNLDFNLRALDSSQSATNPILDTPTLEQGYHVIPPLSNPRLTLPYGDESHDSARGEPDNNPNEANELIHDDSNITGDVTSQVTGGNLNIIDMDWYKIYMHEFGPVKTEYVEININNSNSPIPGQDQRFVAEAFETLYTFMFYNDGQHFSRLDREIVNTYEVKTIDFSSPINAWVYFAIYAIDGAVINYRIDNVTVTDIQPSFDMNNYPDNATKPSTTVVNGKVTQHKDHWDWYDISQYFILEENYTNNITISVDITNENRNANDGWFSWTELFLMFDDELGTTLYLVGGFEDMGWGGSQGVTFSGGVPSEPINRWLNLEGTHAWIGLKVESGFIQDSDLYKLGTQNGWAEYKLTFAVDHVDLNNKPTLTVTDQGVTPIVGTTSEYFTFQVTYTDTDGDPPKYVNVTIDDVSYPMAPTTGGDYLTGKVYEKVIKGSSITDYPYPHSHYFNAADYRATVTKPGIGSYKVLKVLDNDPPYVLETAPKSLVMEEDDDIHTIQLNDIFADPDLDAELQYEIWVGPEDDDYTISYESERLKISFSSTQLKFKPKGDQHGIEEIRLRVTDTFTYTDFINSITDTYNYRAYHNITVTINSVNDNPNINYINDQILTEDEPFKLTITATDIDIDTDGDILTFVTNVTDGLGNDDMPNFAILHNATNPSTSADISFHPTNDNVGNIWVKISVRDTNQSLDSINIKFIVNNVNDFPELVTVGDKEVEPGEELNFIGNSAATEDEEYTLVVVANDVDIDVGASDKLSFETNITDDKGNDDLPNFEITEDPDNSKQALISFLPTNDNVGYLRFNLTVYDGMGGKSQTKVLIEVKNVNDPPGKPEITNPRSGNITFSIVQNINFTGECSDPDLRIPNSDEELTFTWTSNVTSEPLGVGKSILVEDIEDLFGFGYRKITLTVKDKSGLESVTNLTIVITLDLDKDGIWDDWEVEYGLNYRYKMDAYGDWDNDGFTNLDEFLGDDGLPGWEDSTNPWESGSHPTIKEKEDDLSWVWTIAIIVVIVIVIIVLFGFYRKRRKEEEEEEEFFEGPSAGAPGAGMIPPLGMGGVAMPPPQPPGLAPPGLGFPPMMGAPPSDGGLGAAPYVPPLPPSTTAPSDSSGYEDTRFSGGRSAGLASTSASDELSSDYEGHETTVEDVHISDKSGDEVKVWSPGAEETPKPKAKGLKCDNCGADVQAGWFICPSCKNPLRSK